MRVKDLINKLSKYEDFELEFEELRGSSFVLNKKKVLKTYIISIDILTKRCIISLVRSNI